MSGFLTEDEDDPRGADITKLCLFAKALGLRVRFHPGMIPGYQWSGRSQTINVDASDQPSAVVSNIAHEIGHYMVASTADRKCPEFGLGDSQDSLKSAMRIRRRRKHDIEALASMAGICIETVLGMDPSYTFDNHNWSLDSPWEIHPEMFLLHRRGVVSRIRRIASTTRLTMPPPLSKLSDNLTHLTRCAFWRADESVR